MCIGLFSAYNVMNVLQVLRIFLCRLENYPVYLMLLFIGGLQYPVSHYLTLVYQQKATVDLVMSHFLVDNIGCLDISPISWSRSMYFWSTKSLEQNTCFWKYFSDFLKKISYKEIGCLIDWRSYTLLQRKWQNRNLQNP